MLYTHDVKADYERIKARGAEFTMPPTEVMAGSTIATLEDSCGNLIQLTQLARRRADDAMTTRMDARCWSTPGAAGAPRPAEPHSQSAGP